MSIQGKFQAKTRFFTIATAGHVDHGKTSLLKKLTGIDPDRLKEEKERQMTTDLGFAFLPLSENMVLGFIDVPGHGKFLKNMLAGVGGIDLSLLVVAADEGPMPQTIQHVRILSLLGVSRAVVAITKIDLIREPEQVELVREEIESVLQAHGIEALAYCPVSAITGLGADNLRLELQKALVGLPERPKEGSLFLPVDRVFSKSGFGTVITGTLVTGTIKSGDQIFIEPGHLSARVRRLETHGQTVEQANPGQRVACNLVIKEGEKLSRGFVLTGRKVSPSRSCIVSLYDRPRLLGQPLSERLSDQPIRLYHGTAEYQGYLRWVEEQDSASSENAGAAEQEALGFVALQDGAILSPLDRFVVRLSDDTIYGGTILLKDRPRWLSKNETTSLAQMLEAGKPDRALIYFLEASPCLMLTEAQLSAILPEQLKQSLLKKLISEKEILRLDDYVLSSQSRNKLGAGLIEKISAAMLAPGESGEDGTGLETVRRLMQPKLERQAFQALVEDAAARGEIIRKADRLLLPGQKAEKAAAPELAGAEAKIMQLLQEHWCLEIDEISRDTGLDLKTVKSAVQSGAKAGLLVIASYDFVASKEKINACHQILADLWTARRNIAPTDFKERIGVTRKYAMALLQYFDDAKITRRLESGRVLLKGPVRNQT